MPSQKRKFGDICEKVGSRYLIKKGLTILEKNYRKKWGEIDLIAKNGDNLHFIEVKGSLFNPKYDHMPEHNVHMWKTRRLWRAIQTWFMEHPDYEDNEWQIDVMAVFLDRENRRGKIQI